MLSLHTEGKNDYLPIINQKLRDIKVSLKKESSAEEKQKIKEEIKIHLAEKKNSNKNFF